METLTIGLLEYLGRKEGRHPYLEGEDEATLRLLRAINSFIPEAEDDGTDMKNAAFILRQPGREIVLKSVKGDWEYDFCEDSDGKIYGRCVRQPILDFFWDWGKSAVARIFMFAVSLVPNLLGGGGPGVDRKMRKKKKASQRVC